jgi:putative methionine-R-sulfoxide reductase with GAF domain
VLWLVHCLATAKKLWSGQLRGAAGCVAGMAANYYLDNLKKQYATTADRLQAMDKDISKDTADLAKTSAAMKEVISDNQRLADQN